MKKVTAISKIKENSTAMSVLMAVLGLLCLGACAMGLGDSLYHSTFTEKKEEMASLLGTGLIFAACAFIAAYLFIRISRTGTPFSDTSVKGLKNIAFLLFIGYADPGDGRKVGRAVFVVRSDDEGRLNAHRIDRIDRFPLYFRHVPSYPERPFASRFSFPS
jgi:hypothetical protein